MLRWEDRGTVRHVSPSSSGVPTHLSLTPYDLPCTSHIHLNLFTWSYSPVPFYIYHAFLPPFTSSFVPSPRHTAATHDPDTGTHTEEFHQARSSTCLVFRRHILVPKDSPHMAHLCGRRPPSGVRPGRGAGMGRECHTNARFPSRRMDGIWMRLSCELQS